MITLVFTLKKDLANAKLIYLNRISTVVEHNIDSDKFYTLQIDESKLDYIIDFIIEESNVIIYSQCVDSTITLHIGDKVFTFASTQDKKEEFDFYSEKLSDFIQNNKLVFEISRILS